MRIPSAEASTENLLRDVEMAVGDGTDAVEVRETGTEAANRGGAVEGNFGEEEDAIPPRITFIEYDLRYTCCDFC